MARLLVSVRDPEEARAAILGGAAILDVKDPDRGPLGRADVAVWRAVRQVVPTDQPLSLALGELSEWEAREDIRPSDFAGFAYRKLGLSRARGDWRDQWSRLRAKFDAPGGPAWIAVAYADWTSAQSPAPDDILDYAVRARCAGILVDTWKKSDRSPLLEQAGWRTWVDRAKDHGLLTALAGGLDLETIAHLKSWEPDVFAVRGAACAGGNRIGPVQAERVARLVRAIES